jgi:dipeptidyl aminopeptidase/acylaminoacyl peptidase
MRRFIIAGICVFGILFVLLTLKRSSDAPVISPIRKIVEKPLDKYTIERLGITPVTGSDIILEEPVSTTSAYTVHPFHFFVDKAKVSGLAHIPSGASSEFKKPVIIQLRGYVDRENYTTGEGTKRSSEVYASNGFITLAPDFLGYGTSDMPSPDVFEERFQTYTTVLTLTASVGSLPFADTNNIFLWGHSNGGQIALTVLEISQKPIPTSLWAPVTKPFPYSILYYTDDIPDHGKALRSRLAQFENEYDAEAYSLTNYTARITAPLQIHQGTIDDAVPNAWSDSFVNSLKGDQKDVEYFIYPGADHNMSGNWNTVVLRDIQFFRTHLR